MERGVRDSFGSVNSGYFGILNRRRESLSPERERERAGANAGLQQFQPSQGQNQNANRQAVGQSEGNIDPGFQQLLVAAQRFASCCERVKEEELNSYQLAEVQLLAIVEQSALSDTPMTVERLLEIARQQLRAMSQQCMNRHVALTGATQELLQVQELLFSVSPQSEGSPTQSALIHPSMNSVTPEGDGNSSSAGADGGGTTTGQGQHSQASPVNSRGVSVFGAGSPISGSLRSIPQSPGDATSLRISRHGSFALMRAGSFSRKRQDGVDVLVLSGEASNAVGDALNDTYSMATLGSWRRGLTEQQTVQRDRYMSLVHLAGMPRLDIEEPAPLRSRFSRHTYRHTAVFTTEDDLISLLDECSLPLIHDINSPECNVLEEYTSYGNDVFTVVAMNVFLRYRFIQTFGFSVSRLLNFVKTIQSFYRQSNPFHNALRAADVLQTAHVYLCQRDVKENFTDVELLAVLVAALALDVGHLGVSNEFLIKINHPLSKLFSDGTPLESLHLAILFSVLDRQECNFFRNPSVHPTGVKPWTAQNDRDFRFLVTTFIRKSATRNHASIAAEVDRVLSSGRISEKEIPNLLTAIVHLADLSYPLKPWHIFVEWSFRYLAEIYRQSDSEEVHILNTPSEELLAQLLCTSNGFFPQLSTGCDPKQLTPTELLRSTMEFVLVPFMSIMSPVLPQVWSERLTFNYGNLSQAKMKSVQSRLSISAAQSASGSPVNPPAQPPPAGPGILTLDSHLPPTPTAMTPTGPDAILNMRSEASLSWTFGGGGIGASLIGQSPPNPANSTLQHRASILSLSGEASVANAGLEATGLGEQELIEYFLVGAANYYRSQRLASNLTDLEKIRIAMKRTTHYSKPQLTPDGILNAGTVALGDTVYSPPIQALLSFFPDAIDPRLPQLPLGRFSRRESTQSDDRDFKEPLSAGGTTREGSECGDLSAMTSPASVVRPASTTLVRAPSEKSGMGSKQNSSAGFGASPVVTSVSVTSAADARAVSIMYYLCSVMLGQLYDLVNAYVAGGQSQAFLARNGSKVKLPPMAQLIPAEGAEEGRPPVGPKPVRHQEVLQRFAVQWVKVLKETSAFGESVGLTTLPARSTPRLISRSPQTKSASENIALDPDECCRIVRELKDYTTPHPQLPVASQANNSSGGPSTLGVFPAFSSLAPTAPLGTAVLLTQMWWVLSATLNEAAQGTLLNPELPSAVLRDTQTIPVPDSGPLATDETPRQLIQTQVPLSAENSGSHEAKSDRRGSRSSEEDSSEGPPRRRDTPSPETQLDHHKPASFIVGVNVPRTVDPDADGPVFHRVLTPDPPKSSSQSPALLSGQSQNRFGLTPTAGSPVKYVLFSRKSKPS